MLLSTSNDKNLAKIWDTRNQKFLCSLLAHTNWVKGGVFSNDSRLAATCSEDKTVRVWDVHTQDCIRVFYDFDLCVFFFLGLLVVWIRI